MIKSADQNNSDKLKDELADKNAELNRLQSGIQKAYSELFRFHSVKFD